MSTAGQGRSIGGSQASRGRGVRRLLSSGGKLSAVGLVASVLTIAFVIWIQAAMRHQSDVAEPLARSTLELRSALSRSFALLRGWVAYGDGAAKATRVAVWRDEIAPNLAIMKAAASGGGAELDSNEVAELEQLLRRIKYLQWIIEDSARTPANVPARALYEEQLRPIRVEITNYLVGSDSPDAARATLRALIGETDQAVTLLLDTYTPAQAVATRRLAEQTRRAAESYTSDESAEDRAALVREVLAFAARVESIVVLRADPDWNKAAALYKRELRPVQERAAGLIEAISSRQYRAVKAQNRGLFRWSFLILAFALVVGGLSIASIYVSYRLEDRVERALAKAKRVGQYVLEERIGGGGMGQVFRARHALLRRPSAIKVLRTETILDPEAQARFQSEVRITSSLSHPNTIEIYDYGRTSEGFFYYAMELLNGVNLEALVRVSGPLPGSRVVHIIKQVCGSLIEAHRKGLLHRDIKPSNIMLAETGGVFDVAKVLDFGLVLHTEGEPGSEAIVGTPAYLAPETIRAAANASPRSEIYAIGAVAYYLLTGARLFEHDSIADMLRAQLEEQVVLPSLRLGAPIAVDLEAVVVGCLAKDPEERPQTVDELLALLEEVELEPWSNRDARQWWEQYGEAVRAEAAALVGSATQTDAPSVIGPATRS